MQTILLTASELDALLPMETVIDAVQDAFGQLGRGSAVAPWSIAAPVEEGGFHVKAGLLEQHGRLYFAAKTNGNFPGNGGRGLPTIQGVVSLHDAADGRVLAVMDSIAITALRTAAATAVAARFLARPESTHAAVIGCGVQGREQLRALHAVLPLRSAAVHDLDPARAENFAREMSCRLDVEIRRAGSAAEAAAGADLVVTCTTGADYVLDAGEVAPGSFVAGVGVDNPAKRELTPGLLAAARVVTDLRAQCAAIGDLHHALTAGSMRADEVHADLGEVVAGRRPGRVTADEIIVFDSTGIALQDVAAAVAAYRRATELDGVRQVEFA